MGSKYFDAAVVVRCASQTLMLAERSDPGSEALLQLESCVAPAAIWSSAGSVRARKKRRSRLSSGSCFTAEMTSSAYDGSADNIRRMEAKMSGSDSECDFGAVVAREGVAAASAFGESRCRTGCCADLNGQIDSLPAAIFVEAPPDAAEDLDGSPPSVLQWFSSDGQDDSDEADDLTNRWGDSAEPCATLNDQDALGLDLMGP